MKNTFFMPLIGLLFLFSVFASAQSKINKKATLDEEDLIQKSQNLVLQKDRPQAIMVLVKFLNSQAGSKNQFSEVRRNLEEISSIFLSEKTQQLYESNLSFKRKDVNQSLQKMNEALRIEPENNLLISEIGRLQILKKECRSAADLMEQQLKKNPYDELYQLTLAQAHICLKNFTAYQALRNTKDLKKSNYKMEWLLSDLEMEMQSSNKVKVKDLLREIEKADAEHPQLIYWNGKQQSASSSGSTASQEKYSSVCKNLSSAQFRKYFNDPYLCAL